MKAYYVALRIDEGMGAEDVEGNWEILRQEIEEQDLVNPGETACVIFVTMPTEDWDPKKDLWERLRDAQDKGSFD